MHEIKKLLEQELMELETIQKAAEEDLKKAPEGSLRISKNKNTEQYYWRTGSTRGGGRYIKKEQEELIKALAQKDYARKVIAVLATAINEKQKELETIQRLDTNAQLLKTYQNLSPSRQKLVVPYLDTEDEFAVKWEKQKEMEKKKIRASRNQEDLYTEIYTERGECVRSKSEKILADKLYMMKIPYVYEMPFYLSGYGYIKPDFTVLNKITHKEYYWEHFGMMDEKEYCEKAIKKIEGLEKNGIFSGKNLILTYETREHPVNSKHIERLIQEYLL